MFPRSLNDLLANFFANQVRKKYETSKTGAVWFHGLHEVVC
jgi:hypothetical protein